MGCRHLLIDGYNVLHQWEEMAALMRKGAAEAARALLLEKARIIHDDEGIRTTVVFDGKGSRYDIQEDAASPGFVWVFTPSGVTADVAIEQIAMKSARRDDITVVSQDNLVASSVRASGAILIGPDEFMNWTLRSRRSIKNVARRKLDANAKLNPISIDFARDDGPRS